MEEVTAIRSFRPFLILNQVGSVAYLFNIHTSQRTNPVFRASLLKEAPRPPIRADGSDPCEENMSKKDLVLQQALNHHFFLHKGAVTVAWPLCFP